MTDAEKMQEAYYGFKWESDTKLPKETCGLIEEAFKAGYQAAKAESPWVPVDDIPDEWKDGREVDLLFHRTNIESVRVIFRKINCTWDDIDGDWWIPSYSFSEWADETTNAEITHAMLPPNPPKEG